MAFSAVFSTPQTQTSLLSESLPKSQSHTTSSFLRSQATQKSLLYHPLRYKGISEIIEVKPNKRCFGKVKALKKSHTNVEVFSKEHLAVTLAYDVSQLSNKFIQDRGVFTVALSAGSSINYLRSLSFLSFPFLLSFFNFIPTPDRQCSLLFEKGFFFFLAGNWLNLPILIL